MLGALKRQTILRPIAVLAATFATGCGSSNGTPDPAPESNEPLTFNSHIAPIVHANCTTCHNPNGPGPFNLLTYEDVSSRAELIRQVTESRYMPPWLPDSGYGVFAGDRRLENSEIQSIARWVASGASEGDSDFAAPPPYFRGDWRLGEPDLVVSVPRFEVEPHENDVYRNLVVPVPLNEVRYVKSVEVRPGGTNVIHHARLMVDPTNSSRQLDQRDPGPGFDGMHLVSNAQNPAGFFVGWTPGKVPYETPDDMSWPLEPGTDLVLQVHLPASSQPQVVEPQLGLYFGSRPPKRNPALIMLGSFDIDIPPGARDYTVTDSYEVPVDITVLALYPHAHYLGKKIEGFAQLPDGSTRWLIRISNWDFNWQDEYHLAEPVEIPAGAVITMRTTFDNSSTNPRNPSHPPKRVVYGSSSTDEMADLVLQVLPKRSADLGLLQRDIDIWQRNAVVAYMAKADHQDGLVLAAEGRLDEAIELFRSSISQVFDNPQAHNDLGSALAMTGNADLGLEHFREASQLDPTWAEPVVNLAMTQLALGDPEGLAEAVASARRAANLTANRDPVVLNVLARALAATGEMNEAITIAESALRLAMAQSRDELAREIRARIAAWR